MTGPVGPFVLDGTLWGAEHLVLPWMAERMPEMRGRLLGNPMFPAKAIGVLRNGKIVGGVAFSFFYDHPDGGDVQVSVVMEPGARVTRRMWRHLYGYAFNQLRCRRMSMQTVRRNKPARRHAERMGWKLEGVCREAEGLQDLMLYGLLRSDMRANGLPPMRSRHHG